MNVKYERPHLIPGPPENLFLLQTTGHISSRGIFAPFLRKAKPSQFLPKNRHSWHSSAKDKGELSDMATFASDAFSPTHPPSARLTPTTNEGEQKKRNLLWKTRNPKLVKPKTRRKIILSKGRNFLSPRAQLSKRRRKEFVAIRWARVISYSKYGFGCLSRSARRPQSAPATVL